MPQYGLPFITRLRGDGVPDQITETLRQRNALTPQSQVSNPMGPYQSIEELQRLAYQQPQRVRTPRLNPQVNDDVLGYETEDVVEPGWQKNAAIEALKRVQGTQYASEDADRARIEGVREAQAGSALAGFNTPQEAAQYGRRIEEKKLRQPLEQQNIIAQSQRDVTRMQGANQLATAQLQGQQQIALQKAAEEFDKWMMQNAPTGAVLSGVTRPGRYGGGGVRFDTNPQRPNTISPQLMESVRKAKTDLQANRNPATETAYNIAAANAINNAMQQGVISGPTARLATEIAQDENLRDLPWEQLQGYLEPEAGSITDPRELEELYKALLLLRGM